MSVQCIFHGFNPLLLKISLVVWSLMALSLGPNPVDLVRLNNERSDDDMTPHCAMWYHVLVKGLLQKTSWKIVIFAKFKISIFFFSVVCVLFIRNSAHLFFLHRV